MGKVDFKEVYLCVVMLSSLVRFGDLAIQAEQRRLLQGESSGQSRLLQRVEGIILHAAAHRECCGHVAPTQQRKKRSLELLCKKNGWMMLRRTEETSGGADEV